MFRPFTDDERAALAEKLRLWYRQFLMRVSEGRKMPIDKVDSLARGRVWSGDAAHENGLVDKLGGFGSALMRARELARLGPEAEVVVLPRRPSTLLDYVLNDKVVRAKTDVAGEGTRTHTPVLPLPQAFKPLMSRLYLLTTVSAAAPVALYDGPMFAP